MVIETELIRRPEIPVFRCVAFLFGVRQAHPLAPGSVILGVAVGRRATRPVVVALGEDPQIRSDPPIERAPGGRRRTLSEDVLQLKVLPQAMAKLAVPDPAAVRAPGAVYLSARFNPARWRVRG